MIVSSRLIAASSSALSRDVAVEDGEVLAEPVELADVARDRRPLVVGQRLARQPLAATAG